MLHEVACLEAIRGLAEEGLAQVVQAMLDVMRGHRGGVAVQA